MVRPYLSVIIPAYNEAERIPKTLLDIDRVLSSKAYTYEVLVINDGSKDNTSEVVGKMAASIKNLRLIDNHQNKGKGGVVRQGMLEAKGEYRVFTDADNSVSIDHFDAMIPHFESGADVVIGSRAMRGSRLDPAQPLYRQIPGKMGNLWIQLFLLPGIWDTQCGFKAFSAKATEEIFKLGHIKGWGFDVEVLGLARHFGYKIVEIPVHWVNDTQSHVKASAYLQVLIETLKIRWWLWTGAYFKKTGSSA